jgi:CRISPR-associated protein Cas2
VVIVRTYVFYDINDDRVRKRVYEACRDFGLRWLQYSGFAGNLSRVRRGELCAALRTKLGAATGVIVVVPLCERDEAGLLEIASGNERSTKAALLARDRSIMRRLREDNA